MMRVSLCILGGSDNLTVLLVSMLIVPLYILGDSDNLTALWFIILQPFCSFFGSEKFVGLINIFSVAPGGELSTFRVMN